MITPAEKHDWRNEITQAEVLINKIADKMIYHNLHSARDCEENIFSLLKFLIVLDKMKESLKI